MHVLTPLFSFFIILPLLDWYLLINITLLELLSVLIMLGISAMIIPSVYASIKEPNIIQHKATILFRNSQLKSAEILYKAWGKVLAIFKFI